MPKLMFDGGNLWPQIAPPVVLSPVGSVSAVLGFDVVLSPAKASAGVVITSTDYEVRTAPNGGGTSVYSSLLDLVSLLTKTIPIGALSGLIAGQTYYIRARFNTANDSSAYSADAVITT